MMIERKDCKHEELSFGSGDYYIICTQCNAFWGAIHHSQPEYGWDKDGKQVGCIPTMSNQGFGGQLSGQKRIAKP